MDSGPVEPIWTHQVDWDYLNSELRKASKKILYNELKVLYGLPTYQAFCEYLRKHKQVSQAEV